MRGTVILLAAWATGACAAASTANPPAADRQPSAHVITSDELRALSRHDLFAAIAQVRPWFLSPNGRGDGPTVFVDGVLAGAPHVLRSIPVSQVREVRLLRRAHATHRYGSGHSGAVIEVLTRTP